MASKLDKHIVFIMERRALGDSYAGITRLLESDFDCKTTPMNLKVWLTRRIIKQNEFLNFCQHAKVKSADDSQKQEQKPAPQANSSAKKTGILGEEWDKKLLSASSSICDGGSVLGQPSKRSQKPIEY